MSSSFNIVIVVILERKLLRSNGDKWWYVDANFYVIIRLGMFMGWDVDGYFDAATKLLIAKIKK